MDALASLSLSLSLGEVDFIKAHTQRPRIFLAPLRFYRALFSSRLSPLSNSIRPPKKQQRKKQKRLPTTHALLVFWE